tara:strand:- start:143 stop:1120 length:978 start_codon:yes stop_codon:yes gene_type:complete
MTSLAIIGAGLSGITLARQLCEAVDVTVFEKSRGLGGRMATRRSESYQFDHGAQFFTARSDEFQQFLKSLIANNVVSLWEPKVINLNGNRRRFKREWYEPHYIAVPGMNALCKSLACGLDIRLQHEVLSISRDRQGWLLTDASNELHGPFDWVVSATPAPQAVALLPTCFTELAAVRSVSFLPCFSLMLGFEAQPSLHFGGAVVRNSPIGWIAVNSSKIERTSDFAMVVHSDNDWARQHIDMDSEAVADQLLAALQALLGDSLPPPRYQALQRWLYAKVETSAGIDFLLDADNHLAACGDWCRGDRVEDAFLSGYRLAKQLRELL